MTKKQENVLSAECIRKQLRSDNGVRFVDRSAYFQLLISNRDLNRCDLPNARLRGVYDKNSGDRFLIEEEELFQLDSCPQTQDN